MENQAASRIKRQTSHEFYKKLFKLAGAGGAAFWTTDFVLSVSPIAAEYRAAFSISNLPIALIELWLAVWLSDAASVISCFVSLIRFQQKIPF